MHCVMRMLICLQICFERRACLHSWFIRVKWFVLLHIAETCRLQISWKTTNFKLRVFSSQITFSVCISLEFNPTLKHLNRVGDVASCKFHFRPNREQKLSIWYAKRSVLFNVLFYTTTTTTGSIAIGILGQKPRGIPHIKVQKGNNRESRSRRRRRLCAKREVDFVRYWVQSSTAVHVKVSVCALFSVRVSWCLVFGTCIYFLWDTKLPCDYFSWYLLRFKNYNVIFYCYIKIVNLTVFRKLIFRYFGFHTIGTKFCFRSYYKAMNWQFF